MNNNNFSYGIALLVTIMLLSSCAALNRSSARALHYLYLDERNDAGYALQNGDCVKAENKMLEAVSIAKIIQSKAPEVKEAGSDLAEAYKLLGSIYSNDNCKKYPEALDAYNKSIKLREYIYGVDDPLYAHALNDLAWGYYYKQKEYDTAETMLLRAKKIYETNIDNNFYLQMVYSSLGEVYRSQTRYKKADKMFIKMIELINDLVMSEKITPDLVTYKFELYASFLKEQGRNQEAEAIEKKAEENKKMFYDAR